MSERYTRVFLLTENLYLESSPVIIAAGALLKDNENGRIIAQLKFKSLSEKIIKALKVKISLLDTAGNPLSDFVNKDYLDLSIKRDEEFGQKTPIVLPDPSARAFTVTITEVIFTDNSFWKNENEAVEQMTKAELLSEKFSDVELIKQYKIKYGNNCKFFPERYKDLWYCACGAVNRETEDKCHTCGKLVRDLFSFDINKLTADKNERIENEQKAAEKAKAKAKKIFTIAASAIFVVILLLTKVIIPNSNYNSAVALMESGEYEEAILAFKAMDGYKDSAEQIKLCNTAIKDEAYAQALSLYNAGEYEKAIAAFEALGDYKDSAEMITETHYMQATALLESGNYAEAYSKYKSISGYKDVDTLLETDENLLAAARRAEWTTIGNIVTFGSYEQDNNTSNGQEDIEWIVLATEGDKSLIISKYALDCRKYNTEYTSVTWETCSLRTWLNETFYNSAFSTAEQAQILKTTVTDDKNPDYSTSPGNDTKDNVFLLSITEANKYFSSDSERMCVPTAYAIAQGAWTSSSYSVGGNATCWWWLRSPGFISSYAAYVFYVGSVYTYGNYALDGHACVRPALWVEVGE